MKFLLKIMRFSKKSPEFSEIFSKFTKFWWFFKINIFKKKSVNYCRFWKMLKNAPFLITIGVDTAENEPRKGWCVVARSGVSILRASAGHLQRHAAPWLDRRSAATAELETSKAAQANLAVQITRRSVCDSHYHFFGHFRYRKSAFSTQNSVFFIRKNCIFRRVF